MFCKLQTVAEQSKYPPSSSVALNVHHKSAAQILTLITNDCMCQKICILSCQTQTAMNKIGDRMLAVSCVLAEQKEVHTSFSLASGKKINSLWR